MDKNNIEKHSAEKNVFGFWLYLMTDLLMFAALFATYAVLRDSNFGGITIYEIFNPPFVLAETLILLTSSFVCGLGLLAARNNNKNMTLLFFSLTFLLGATFLVMETFEFNQLIAEGYGPDRSAFLSSFFTLVGTHGLHIAAGLIWIGVLLIRIIIVGITEGTYRKLTLLSLFWHFLDIVWIFIFTIVYLFAGFSQ